MYYTKYIYNIQQINHIDGGSSIDVFRYMYRMYKSGTIIVSFYRVDFKIIHVRSK